MHVRVVCVCVFVFVCASAWVARRLQPRGILSAAAPTHAPNTFNLSESINRSTRARIPLASKFQSAHAYVGRCRYIHVRANGSRSERHVRRVSYGTHMCVPSYLSRTSNTINMPQNRSFGTDITIVPEHLFTLTVGGGSTCVCVCVFMLHCWARADRRTACAIWMTHHRATQRQRAISCERTLQSLMCSAKKKN